MNIFQEMEIEMDLRELEYFTVIAKEKNLSRAARILYIGQPTLSKFLQKLEEEWGVPLFSRISGELCLTYAGERYLYYARQILALNHNLKNEMHEILASRLGSLHVGMPPVRCSLILPKVLPEFHARYPGVDFQIMESSSNHLDESLLDGSLDLAFYALSRPLDTLSYEVILEDRIYAVVKKGHPIADRAFLRSSSENGGSADRYISIEWLKEEVFLLQNRNQRQGEYIRALLDQLRFYPPRIQEHSNIRAALALAASGYGVCFIGGSLLTNLRHDYTIDAFLLQEAEIPIRFVAAWRKGSFLPGYSQDFIQLVRNQYVGQNVFIN